MWVWVCLIGREKRERASVCVCEREGERGYTHRIAMMTM